MGLQSSATKVAHAGLKRLSLLTFSKQLDRKLQQDFKLDLNLTYSGSITE